MRQPRVRVEPAGIEFPAEPGETIMAAAHRAGYYWPTICQGNARCNRCYVVVCGDESALAPMAPAERVGLERVRWRDGPVPGERLACQATLRSDATVIKHGVTPAGAVVEEEGEP